MFTGGVYKHDLVIEMVEDLAAVSYRKTLPKAR
jgi:methyl coenzyme M reductase subunit C-like uncharacterized protein (methanogenesis marker protein 7)